MLDSFPSADVLFPSPSENKAGPLCFTSFIAGKTTLSTGPTVPIINPSTNKVLAHVSEASDIDVKDAITSATEAFQSWRRTSSESRAKILQNLYDLLQQNKDDLARTITLENGKPLAEAVDEVDFGASYFQWYAVIARTAKSSSGQHLSSTTTAILTHEPIGVCLGVTPWNHPIAMLARKVAAALAAGCAIIAKPSEFTPLSALALSKLAVKAGVPDGLFNVVIGAKNSAEIVRTILEARFVRMVSFTGSTRVGKIIAEVAAKRTLRTCLELGGHAPFVVFDDCDIDATIDALLKCKFRGSGQTCTSANRVYVQNGVHDAFCEKLVECMAEMVVGDGLDESVNVGPLITQNAVHRVMEQVEEAMSKGAKMLFHGSGDSIGENFLAPRVLGDVTDDMLICKVETFGPVLPVLRFDTVEEVVDRCNSTEAGLAAYVFTNNMRRSMQMMRELDFGMVGLNSVQLRDTATAFGGMKESGSGREGGASGLEDYTEAKYCLMQMA